MTTALAPSRWNTPWNVEVILDVALRAIFPGFPRDWRAQLPRLHRILIHTYDDKAFCAAYRLAGLTEGHAVRQIVIHLRDFMARHPRNVAKEMAL